MNQMPYEDKKGRIFKYGEFFPTEIMPFSYNDSVVCEYFPLTKEEILEKGYKYKDPETKIINQQYWHTNPVYLRS